VDEAVARLADLAGRPVPGHVEIFEDVHQRLQDLLAGADRAAGGQGPGGQDSGAQRGGERGGEPPRPPAPSRPVFPGALRPRP
jgi:hypothetical protein